MSKSTVNILSTTSKNVDVNCIIYNYFNISIHCVYTVKLPETSLTAESNTVTPVATSVGPKSLLSLVKSLNLLTFSVTGS